MMERDPWLAAARAEADRRRRWQPAPRSPTRARLGDLVEAGIVVAVAAGVAVVAFWALVEWLA